MAAARDCTLAKDQLSDKSCRHTKGINEFSQLGLAPAQVSACESLGYTEPTPIQEQAIPVILSGQDRNRLRRNRHR
jgi:superfamily II DNA/RNA helicase